MIEIETPWPDRVLVLQGEPDLALFTEEELAVAATHRLPKRREEWLLSRAAAKRLALRTEVAQEPSACSVVRPKLRIAGRDSEWYVSLSHSAPYAAAALSRMPIGIDVQGIRPLPDAAAHLFLTESEIEAMRACSLDEALLHFWCAKEAAFKRRSPELVTLKQVPLRLISESATSLRFDDAVTTRSGDVIVAVSGE